MEETEQEVIDRLKKIEGQLRGLQRMIEDHRGCEAVLTQMLSARTALDRVAARVVAVYLDECLAKPPAETRRELLRVVQLLSRIG
ncbi:MAG: metal-sensitive transcriptional regulator [Dehalococcoidia bacterium]